MNRSFQLLFLILILGSTVKAQYWKPATPNYTGKVAFCFDEIMVLDTIAHPDSLTFSNPNKNMFYYIYDTTGCPTVPGLRLNTKGSYQHNLTFDGKLPTQKPFHLFIRSVRLWNPDGVNHQFLHSDSCQRITLSVDTFPIPNLGKDTIINHGDSTILSVGNYFKIKWSDGSTKQSISVKDSGSYWVETETKNGCKGRDSIQVNVKNATSLNPVFSKEKINMYPNPSSGIINVKLEENVRVKIVNIRGQEIKGVDLYSGLNTLDLTDLKNGLYFLIFKELYSPIKIEIRK